MMRERRFHTGMVEINYAEGPPNGRPFVLLHGGAGSWEYGSALVRALEPQWHVYAPDLRGHGKSGHVRGRYRLQDYVADTTSFLGHIVQEPAIVYGHSLGGEVAIMVAAEQPGLVRALIVGDAPLSVVGHPTEEETHKAMNVLWQSLAGKPTAEIAPALRAMSVRVPGDSAPRTASDVFGAESPWFAHQSENLHQLDPDVLRAVSRDRKACLPVMTRRDSCRPSAAQFSCSRPTPWPEASCETRRFRWGCGCSRTAPTLCFGASATSCMVRLPRQSVCSAR